jgi:hypothetical protein
MQHQKEFIPISVVDAASDESLPLGHKGQALFMNNTATGYHWGCYGTSMAIYETIIRSGYSIATVDVDTTHEGLGYPPTSASDQSIVEFAEQLQVVNSAVFRAIRDSDLLVVNGEGTLHRFHRAPRTLLSVLRLAKMMGKRVHLINHACFPSGGQEPASQDVEQFYAECLRDLDRIVVRDEWSAKTYERMGIKHSIGFDCLPLYIRMYAKPVQMPSSILIGGASHWTPDIAMNVGRMLSTILGPTSVPVVFLAGGFKREPREDAVHYEILKKVIPNIQLARPTSFSDWIGWIRSAELMITGRFHHFVAAATLSTPIVTMPGNTAKTNALAAMLGAPPPLAPTSANAPDALSERISKPFRTSPAQVQAILEDALVNFDF